MASRSGGFGRWWKETRHPPRLNQEATRKKSHDYDAAYISSPKHLQLSSTYMELSGACFLPLHCTVFLLRRCTFVTDVHHAEVHRLFFLRQWVIGLYIMLDLDIDGCTNARERA